MGLVLLPHQDFKIHESSSPKLLNNNSLSYIPFSSLKATSGVLVPSVALEVIRDREDLAELLNKNFPLNTWISIDNQTGLIIAHATCQAEAQLKTIEYLREQKKRGSCITWHITGLRRMETEV